MLNSRTTGGGISVPPVPAKAGTGAASRTSAPRGSGARRIGGVSGPRPARTIAARDPAVRSAGCERRRCTRSCRSGQGPCAIAPLAWRAAMIRSLLAALAAALVLAPAAHAADYTVTSFDGTPIAAHWFPTGPTAPTVLMGPGWGASGDVNEAPGGAIARFRGAGYNVLTWDPRGFGSSGRHGAGRQRGLRGTRRAGAARLDRHAPGGASSTGPATRARAWPAARTAAGSSSSRRRSTSASTRSRRRSPGTRSRRASTRTRSSSSAGPACSTWPPATPASTRTSSRRTTRAGRPDARRRHAQLVRRARARARSWTASARPRCSCRGPSTRCSRSTRRSRTTASCATRRCPPSCSGTAAATASACPSSPIPTASTTRCSPGSTATSRATSRSTPARASTGSTSAARSSPRPTTRRGWACR